MRLPPDSALLVVQSGNSVEGQRLIGVLFLR